MKRKRTSPWALTVLCCTLAVPTVAGIMGIYGADTTLAVLRPAITVGALLGLFHLLLRPVLRLLFAPVGCLTLGLFGFVIDVALIYVAACYVPGFKMPGMTYAVLTALTINTICAITGARR